MSEDKTFNLKLEKLYIDETYIDRESLNPDESEYIDYIEESNKEFFNKFNISELANETEDRLKISPKVIKGEFKRYGALLTAAAACLIIAINILPTNNREPEILLKGDDSLNIYLQENNKINRVNNMATVHSNDRLQITYKTVNDYGIIFSVDGLRNITFHYPEDSYSSVKLDVGNEVTLPSSYTLDNAPYFEKFYMITCKDSFDLDMVKDHLDSITVKDGKIVSDITLPENYNINTLMLLKE